jgi:hypothetical protein
MKSPPVSTLLIIISITKMMVVKLSLITLNQMVVNCSQISNINDEGDGGKIVTFI